MAFWLQIQADYGSESLQNVHPDREAAGGKAVCAFLDGLQVHCSWTEEDPRKHPELTAVEAWYRVLEQYTGTSLSSTCGALLDCMWGEGDDPLESSENWKAIDEVTRGVRILLDAFRNSKVQPLEGFYEPENTIPDFEALLANLELLARRGNKVVRLNFY